LQGEIDFLLKCSIFKNFYPYLVSHLGQLGGGPCFDTYCTSSLMRAMPQLIMCALITDTVQPNLRIRRNVYEMKCMILILCVYSHVEIFIYCVFHFIPIDNFVNLVFAIRQPSSRNLVLRDRDCAVHNKIPYETDKRDYREIYRLYVP